MKYPDYSIYNTTYYPNMHNAASFELRSFLGRLFFGQNLRIDKDKTNLLNLGCGNFTFNEWINADFFSIERLLNTKKVPSLWCLDMRFPLKCADNVFDGIFCEHVMEHLSPMHALSLMKELYRILKPFARVRIAVPDLEKYVNFYRGEIPNEDFLKWDSGCEAIRSLSQNYGHLSLWDYSLLKKFLEEAKFSNIKKETYLNGADKRLLKDCQGREWETLYIEAQKIDE